MDEKLFIRTTTISCLCFMVRIFSRAQNNIQPLAIFPYNEFQHLLPKFYLVGQIYFTFPLSKPCNNSPSLLICMISSSIQAGYKLLRTMQFSHELSMAYIELLLVISLVTGLIAKQSIFEWWDFNTFILQIVVNASLGFSSISIAMMMWNILP